MKKPIEEKPKEARELKADEEQVVPMLDEARMVLPGIQSLFGFQLVAVFSSGFGGLSGPQKLLHFASLVATLVAIALIMSPAAHHRLAERWTPSVRFVRISSRLIALAMTALMIGLSIEIALISDVLFESLGIAVALGAALAAILASLWFVWPLAARQSERRRRHRP